jgi:hypothetical protein
LRVSFPSQAPDLSDGFILGEIADFATDSIHIQPLSGGAIVEAPYDAVYPSEEDGASDKEDNCALMFLNEATLLYNLKVRYQKDLIYTSVKIVSSFSFCLVCLVVFSLTPYRCCERSTGVLTRSIASRTLFRPG